MTNRWQGRETITYRRSGGWRLAMFGRPCRKPPGHGRPRGCKLCFAGPRHRRRVSRQRHARREPAIPFAVCGFEHHAEDLPHDDIDIHMLAAFKRQMSAVETGQRLDEIADLRQQADARVRDASPIAAGACCHVCPQRVHAPDWPSIRAPSVKRVRACSADRRINRMLYAIARFGALPLPLRT